MRKFDEHGDWHYFTLFGRAGAWRLIFNPHHRNEIIERYWYVNNR